MPYCTNPFYITFGIMFLITVCTYSCILVRYIHQEGVWKCGNGSLSIFQMEFWWCTTCSIGLAVVFCWVNAFVPGVLCLMQIIKKPQKAVVLLHPSSRGCVARMDYPEAWFDCQSQETDVYSIPYCIETSASIGHESDLSMPSLHRNWSTIF